MAQKVLYEKDGVGFHLLILDDDLYPDSVVVIKEKRTGQFPVDTLLPKEAIIQVANLLQRGIK